MRDLNTSFLCDKSALPALLEQAEREKDAILAELKGYMTGTIDISIRPVAYPTGYAVAGDLLVNDELVRSYNCIDLLFLDLNNLMFAALCKARAVAGAV